MHLKFKLTSHHTYTLTPDCSKIGTLSISADDLEVGIGLCGWIMTAVSWLLVLVTLPFSLFFCFKVSE